MDEYYNTLSNCVLFRQIEIEDFSHLLTCLNTRIRTYNTDEYVFFLGDEVNYIGVVLKGSIEIVKETLAGNRHIVAVLGPSSIFGEGVVCTKKRIAPVSVRVKEPSNILLIPYEKIIKSCGNSCSFHTQLIHNMMMILGEKNYTLNHKIDMLMLKGMREKIATFLLQESNERATNSFTISLNRTELAEYLNVSRTSMCRELARMKEEDIIDYYQNSFKIKDKDLLYDCLD